MRTRTRHWLLPVALLLAAAGFAADDAERSVPLPDGTVVFGGHHYLLVDGVEDLSWDSALARCEGWGATLAVVTDEDEAAFVAGLCDGRYMYLGATDRDEEGAWAWVDGTPWEYTNWMDGQPNDYNGEEDYLATYDDGEWVDVAASGSGFWMPTGFICEWSRQSAHGATP